MNRKKMYLVALCMLSSIVLFAQDNSAETSSIFIQWEDLDKSNYATLKVAFNEDENTDLISICLGGDLLCIEGKSNDDQVWVWTKEIIEVSFPNTLVVWKSDMTSDENLRISKSYRLQPTE